MPQQGEHSTPWEAVAAVVALLGAAAWFQPEISGGDLWWLLASGREILESGSIPTVDSFSYTFAGRPWMNHEWLWSVPFWVAYRLSPDAVAWLNLAVLLAVFGLVYAVARQESGSAPAALLSVWAAAATSHGFLDVRPHLVTLGCVALLLLTRRRPWAPWTWPVLFLAWVNLHGGFLFGLGVIGLVALERTLDESMAAGRLALPRPVWAGVALSFLAALVNPWGWHIVEYPLAYLEGASVFRGISEWLPPGFGVDPRTFNGRFCWLVVASAPGLLVAFRRARPLVMVWGVTLAMAATSRRFIPLHAVVAAPLLAMGIAAILDRARARLPRSHPALPRTAAAVLGLVCVSFMWRDVRLTPRPLDRWTLGGLLPRAGLAHLRAIGPPLRPFHDFNWGGYITLNAPELRVFIDGRANTLYDDALAADYLELDSVGDGYREVIEGWRVDAVFVESRHPLVRALRREADPWRLVYRDAISAILLPPGSPHLSEPLPEPETDTPAVLLLTAQRALRDESFERARVAARRAIEQDPLFFLAYRELALAQALEGDAEGMARTIEEGIEAYPRGRRRFRAFEGLAWERLGDAKRALDAYHDAMPRGPFDHEPAVAARIRVLEAE